MPDDDSRAAKGGLSDWDTRASCGKNTDGVEALAADLEALCRDLDSDSCRQDRPAERPPARPHSRRKSLRPSRRGLIFVLLWFTVLFGVFRFLVGVTVLSGNSMRPALYSGDILLYQRLGIGKVERGDILIIKNADGAGRSVAKRVVAVSGDTVSVDENGRVILNGEPLREQEVLFGYQPDDEWLHFPINVEPGEYFFLGDNRPASLDSRTAAIGKGTTAMIQGKVVAVIRTAFK